MALDIIGFGLDFIATYGLIAILVLLVLDGALLLPVFPGEIVLIMAVAAYAHDIPSLVFLIVVTTAAGVAGSLLLYGVTRGGGRRLVERFPRIFMMPTKRRERLERSFQRPLGQSMVLFLRLVPLTRILVNIPAGLAKMPLVRFLVLTTVGLLVYHAAFLYFAFEANRPGSAISDQREHLQEAYASPAWTFVEANQAMTGLVLLVLGVVVGTRAAIRMHNDPGESTGSVIGWATTLILLWGGGGLAVATYIDPHGVYALAKVGGVDVETLAPSIGLGPLQLLWGVSAVAFAFGLVLSRMRGAAQTRRHEYRAWKKAKPDLGPTPARVVVSTPVTVDGYVIEATAADLEVEAEEQEPDGDPPATRPSPNDSESNRDPPPPSPSPDDSESNRNPQAPSDAPDDD